MSTNSTDKLKQSIRDLREAMELRNKALTQHVIYAGIAKCFEVSLEYSWKFLKRQLDEQGVEAYSPKEIVKAAGRVGLIDDVEQWIKFINIRNIAAHDYLGITPSEYLDLIEDFLPRVTKLMRASAD